MEGMTEGRVESPLMCIDYISAMLDYEKFVLLAVDHRELREFGASAADGVDIGGGLGVVGGRGSGGSGGDVVEAEVDGDGILDQDEEEP